MPDHEELWIPLVDEPIGSILAEIQRENPDIAKLVESPHRILAFRTFAYIRCGLLLGQLLFDNDMALAAYHLPLDAHLEVGNNALLAAGLRCASRVLVTRPACSST